MVGSQEIRRAVDAGEAVVGLAPERQEPAEPLSEAAEREMSLFFGGEGEIQDWTRMIEGWIYDLSGPEPE